MAGEEELYHFQVNLGGMLDILSNHLYTSADVFLRELLQNGVDAITLRRQRDPGWRGGCIHIRVYPGEKMVFTDNGAGLTREEINRFLSVIGQSSKHDLLSGEMSGDYIGRFGIGLLSCFMVSDSIVIHTRSTESPCAYEWTGRPDGTYTLRELEGTAEEGQEPGAQGISGKVSGAEKDGIVSGKVPGAEKDGIVSEKLPGAESTAEKSGVISWTVWGEGTAGESAGEVLAGTSVLLECKPGCEEYFQPDTLMRLVQYYGLMLPVSVYLNDREEPLNQVPENFSYLSRSRLLEFGAWMFEESFLEAIPIQTPHLSGAAYVLPYETDSMVKNGHRIYLKNMLLTDQGVPLLPEWAFFLRCFLNTTGLRPTASRESFYEDSELQLARDEFSGAVKEHFKRLAQDRPEILQSIVSVHYHAIKAMAVWDDEIFRLFIDYLPFVTSEGDMTGSALKRVDEALYVSELSRFQQLKSVFNAQNRLLICTGYTYDDELIPKLAEMFGLSIMPMHEEDMEDVLREIPWQEGQKARRLTNAFNRSLEEFDCRAEIRSFQPQHLPALYFMSDDVRFIRKVLNVRENTAGVFSEALSSLLSGTEDKAMATLYLNYYNPLIQRLLHDGRTEVLESVAKILYVQALASGGHSLHHRELKALGDELLYLVELNGE